MRNRTGVMVIEYIS